MTQLKNEMKPFGVAKKLKLRIQLFKTNSLLYSYYEDNAQHNALSKAIKTRFKIESIYCDVSS